MAEPWYTVATGIAGGLTAAVVAISAGDLFQVPQSVNVWIGIGVAGAIGTAVLLAAKKWIEGQVAKLIELPSKQEIFDAIEEGIKKASGYHSSVLLEVGTLSQKLEKFHEDFQGQYHGLDIRVSEIETRHETEDRIKLERSRGAHDSGEIPR